MQKKLYRIGDEHLLLVKSEIVLSFYIKYKLFDIKKNSEILFSKITYKDLCSERPLIKYCGYPSEYKHIDIHFIMKFVKCSFDKGSENYINIKILEKKLMEKEYRLEYEIENYSKDEGNNTIKISKDEFIQKIKIDLKKFDTKENKLCWRRYYETYPILEEGNNEKKKRENL